MNYLFYTFILILVSIFLDIHYFALSMKNSEILLNYYPEELKQKWERYFKKPIAYFGKTLVLRILIILLFYLINSFIGFELVLVILDGFVLYSIFYMAIEELKKVIAMGIVINRIKTENIEYPSYKKIYISLKVDIANKLGFGLIPLLLLIIFKDTFFIGLSIAGLMIILLNFIVLLRYKRKV